MFAKDFDTPFGDLEVVPVEPAPAAGRDATRSGLLAELDSWEPGLPLAAFLATVDRSRLSGHDRITLLRARQKLISHLTANLYADIASVTKAMVDEFGDDPEMAHESAAMELRAALRLTRRSAEKELELADDLTERLPDVVEAMEQGRLDLRRARVLADGTCHLNEKQARQVVDKVVETAGELTTGQLAAKVRKLCMAVQPEEAENRYQQAVDNRRMVREATVDGTANLLILDCPPNRAGEAFNRINAIAKSLCSPGETRTMDQLRTDIALDLLCGRKDYKTTGRGIVNIHVDLKTLAELADTPGELAGFGPVVADIARQVTEEQQGSEWRFRVTDPDTRMPLHIGTTKRRADTKQERHVELRDLTCITPGCRMPATECDLDHTTPWARSHRTSVGGLAPLCRHDHVGRHKFGWTYRRLPGGDYLWTSRLGHTYTTSGRPPPKPG